jgi:hypothetical protein
MQLLIMKETKGDHEKGDIVEISSSTDIESPDIAHIHNLIANEISSTSSIDLPVADEDDLTDYLVSTEITSITDIETSDLGQTHELSGNEISSITDIETSDLGQTHELSGNEINSISNIDNSVIGQEHELNSNEISSIPFIDEPIISHIHNLITNEISSTSNIENTTLEEIYNLITNEISSTSNIENTTLEEIYNLIANEINSITNIDNATLEEIYNLITNEISSTSNINDSNIEQVHILGAEEINSITSFDTPKTAEYGMLVAEDIEITTSVDDTDIGQAHNLLANEIESTSFIESPEYGLANFNLITNEISSTSNIDDSNIEQVHILGAEEISSEIELEKYIYIDQDQMIKPYDLSIETNINQEHNLLTNEITSASINEEPEFIAITPMMMNNIISNTEIENPEINQTHNLVSGEVNSITTIEETIINKDDLLEDEEQLDISQETNLSNIFNYYDELSKGSSLDWISYINRYFIRSSSPEVKVFKLDKKATPLDNLYGETSYARIYTPPFSIRAHYLDQSYQQMLGLESMPYLETDEGNIQFVINFDEMVQKIRNLKKLKKTKLYISYKGTGRATIQKLNNIFTIKVNGAEIANFDLTSETYNTVKKLNSAINALTNFTTLLKGENDSSIDLISFNEAVVTSDVLLIYSLDKIYLNMTDVIEKGDVILTNKWKLYEVASNIPGGNFGWDYSTFILTCNLRTLDEVQLPGNYNSQIIKHQHGLEHKVDME